MIRNKLVNFMETVSYNIDAIFTILIFFKFPKQYILWILSIYNTHEMNMSSHL